jgi:hypothetical protein
MNTTKTQGLKVKAGIKAGAFIAPNHNRLSIRVSTGIKAGAGIYCKNHSRRLIRSR